MEGKGITQQAEQSARKKREKITCRARKYASYLLLLLFFIS